MGGIEEIYEDLDAEVPLEKFQEAVADKVEQMAGLADEETAAMLVAHELTDRVVHGIDDIEAGMDTVRFTGKVISVGTRRTFDRDDGTNGRVVNVEVADESGRITCAFWDEQADAATEELEPGTVLRIEGRPRDGYRGVEVSVTRAETDEDTDIDVPTEGPGKIADLDVGQENVTLRGRVLGTSAIRTFTRDDGTQGRVANLTLGDETGRIRLTLWGDQTDLVTAVAAGKSVEIIEGYVRERNDEIELHVGDRGRVDVITEDIPYEPDAADITDVEIGDMVDLMGVVRSADPKRTFDRDDGSEGQVRNIRVQDKTGDIRAALWGEHADVDVQPGDEVILADVEIKDGWQDDHEASVGWQSTVSILTRDHDQPNHDEPVSKPEDPTDLSAFATGEVTETDESHQSDPAGKPHGTGAGEEKGEGTLVSFTGVVVQPGDPVLLDDGDRTMTVETDTPVELGEEVTVTGVVQDGRLRAEDVTRAQTRGRNS